MKKKNTETTERANFWTQFEIAQYIKKCVDCGKEINIEIVDEWNKIVTKGHKDNDDREDD